MVTKAAAITSGLLQPEGPNPSIKDVGCLGGADGERRDDREALEVSRRSERTNHPDHIDAGTFAFVQWTERHGASGLGLWIRGTLREGRAFH